MGYIIHHAIIITSRSAPLMQEALERAAALRLITGDVCVSEWNGFSSFLIPPDGSKDGWQEDREGDIRRAMLIDWLDRHVDGDGFSPFEWVLVRYGDDEKARIEAHSGQLKRLRRKVQANKAQGISR